MLTDILRYLSFQDLSVIWSNKTTLILESCGYYFLPAHYEVSS